MEWQGASEGPAGDEEALRGPAPSRREALRFWAKLGFVSFGGPAGQVAIMHTELVERRRWLSESEFLRALNFTMVLPGPEAQQLATYAGWRLHGVAGGVAAGALFVLPGAVLMLLLSWLAAAHAHVPMVAGVLYGVQPVVVAIVAEAVVRIGRRTLRHGALFAFAAAAFVALFVLSVPFPAVVLGAALAGFALRRVLPAAFGDSGTPHPNPRHSTGGWGRAVRLVAVFAALWALPVLALVAWRGASDVLVTQALFFTKAAFVTFGGAYAVLSYVADAAVFQFSWLTGAQMVQGLGLAESTPGPLILVLEYVGFLGAYGASGGFPPALYGTLGASVTTYVTFLPSFFLVLLGAPHVERLASDARLHAAFTGVTAAVVGVVLNLAVFFGHRVILPVGGLDVVALGIAVATLGLMRVAKVPVALLVAAGAALGAVLVLAGVR